MGQILGQIEDTRGHTGGGNRKGRKASFGSIRQRGPKRFQARYTGPDGETYTAYSAGGSATFQTKADAEGALAKVRVEIDAGTWVSPTAIRTVGETGEPGESATLFRVYATAWLATRDLSPRTVEHYTYLLNKHILPTWGEVELTAITPAAVRTWNAREGVKPTARSHSYSLLRSITGTAVSDGILQSNPCAIRGAGTAKTTKRIRPLEVEDVNALAEALPERYRMLAQLGCWCSLRFGELAGLQRVDVDLDAGLIHVRRGVVRTKDGLVAKTPKTEAGLRSVTLPKHLVKPLRAHLRDHAAPGDDGWVFPGRNGGPLAASTLQRVWGPAAAKAGRPDVTPHTLRHTGQTLAAQSGANLRELMARAGQVSPAAALRYLHDADTRQREIADALSKLATGKTAKGKPPKKR